jgi:inhibitor of KinA
MSIVVADCGDSAVTVRAVGNDPEDNWRLVHALADAIEAARLDGVHGVMPTYDALLVEFDCATTDHATVRRTVELATLNHWQPRSRTFVVPVVYGGEHGPDLPIVAAQLGLTSDEVIRLHTATALKIRCLGAPVGAPMMDGPAFPRPVPRLASPRTSVPPGSVAVAGRQAVICPLRSPGGWPLLGRTPLRILDLESEALTPYRPGDTIRFVPIPPEQWDSYDGLALEAEHG